ncbi:hypothetical protein C2845_PM15G25610 [Panicum miliaceum]|uniref:Uncharacterized protein n=1 Tax=Panicum miliaceum TaxID=4540 RepID=A0A3L6Q4B8_PANMI|nr:hypothetical protein C2845_PM15G25610 [Panicum miliaceum]
MASGGGKAKASSWAAAMSGTVEALKDPGGPLPLELRVPVGAAARQGRGGRRGRLRLRRQRARAAFGGRRGGCREEGEAGGGGGAPDGHVHQQLGPQQLTCLADEQLD